MDSSQTLYEFRASNPRALNVMEGSGVFATHKLQVNYRSNQEILDFANVTLADIEANQYAQIQLRSNSLAPVTSKSFIERVNLEYYELSKMGEWEDAMPLVFRDKIVPYINKCLAKKEPVTFLAFTRDSIQKFKDLVFLHYPNFVDGEDVVDLVPERPYNSTIFSSFICKYWDEVKFMPSQNLTTTIRNEVMNRLDRLVYDVAKAQNAIVTLLNDWVFDNKELIKLWQMDVVAGKLSRDEFLDRVKENMLEYEIRRNAIRQSIISEANAQKKEDADIDNAKILLSTIHSAKGLEFENVVVLYQAKNDLPEDKKRMYYVAFTRAMNTELVIAYDTSPTPLIVEQYDHIVDALIERETNQATSGII